MLLWNKCFYMNRLRCKNAPYMIERFNKAIAYFVAYDLSGGTQIIGDARELWQIKEVCDRHYSEAKQAFLDKLDN